jgi:hypothetical protein
MTRSILHPEPKLNGYSVWPFYLGRELPATDPAWEYLLLRCGMIAALQQCKRSNASAAIAWR